MEVTFYKCYNGHVQTKKSHKVEKMTKAELMKISDLRHPVLTQKEFYETLSTDRYGKLLDEFHLFSHNNDYLVIKTKVK